MNINEQNPVGPDFRPPERVELERQFKNALDGLLNAEYTCPWCDLYEEALTRMFKSDDEYGCGFYNQDDWRKAYDDLRHLIEARTKPR